MALFTFCVMRCDSAKHHILGHCGPRQGTITANSNSAKIFVQCTYPQVSSSCVYSFGSYRDDKPTHKQIAAKGSNVLRCVTTLGKNPKLTENRLHKCRLRINTGAVDIQTSPMQTSCDRCNSTAVATPSKSYITNHHNSHI